MKFSKDIHLSFLVFIFIVLNLVFMIDSHTGRTRITEKEKVECDTLNWALIENEDFELDMEKMDIVLIKRSFNEGDEVTLIELADGKQRHFVCSRSIYQRLVNEFRKIKESRKEGEK